MQTLTCLIWWYIYTARFSRWLIRQKLSLAWTLNFYSTPIPLRLVSCATVCQVEKSQNDF